MSDLAIIIVSWNVRPLLENALQSLQASLARTPALTTEIWVVDNASADGSAAMVTERFPQVRLLQPGENLGFARGNNLALRELGFGRRETAATPRAVWLLNPDTLVQSDAPFRLWQTLMRIERAGAVGPRLLYADGSHQHGAFRFPGFWQTLFDFFPPPYRVQNSLLNGRYPLAWYRRGTPFPVDFVLGAALMVKREAIRQVGLLDEDYFMYVEEMDWQQRFHRAGWQVYCDPGTQVTHLAGQSSRQFREEMFVALWRSRLRYFRRYHAPWFNRLIGWTVRVGLTRMVRQDRQAARTGKLPPTLLAQRLTAYDKVRRLAWGKAA